MDSNVLYRIFERIKKLFQQAPNSKETNKYREWLELDKGEELCTSIVYIDDINENLEDI